MYKIIFLVLMILVAIATVCGRCPYCQPRFDLRVPENNKQLTEQLISLWKLPTPIPKDKKQSSAIPENNKQPTPIPESNKQPTPIPENKKQPTPIPKNNKQTTPIPKNKKL